MTPEQWQRAKDVFAAASELKASARAEYVSSVASDDALVQSEVLSLLAAPEIDALEKPAVEWARDWWHDNDGVDPWLGKRIGAYRIEALIGSGGMGDVYDATRADDEYHGHVAIKLLRANRANQAMVRRFKAERQILATLEHRNIAKLLDGGTTEDGVPYFAMEKVEGLPIDRYCEQNALGIEDRIRLFMQVCAAVDYAHRHLVLHRDIKPSNIFVTTDGSVKLLDFGIAKLIRLGDELTNPGESLAGTLTVLPVLTPAFCSPEQARGEPLTTATDIYSLGAVLYLLLTGRHAHPFTQSKTTTWSAALTSDDPPKPSIAAQGFSIQPGTHDSHQWQRRLRGDLDSIVLMALRKEPALRYTSAEHLADDLRRHLNHQPVLARGGQLTYTAGRFIRRHRTAMAAAALIAVVLIGAVVVTNREARIARDEKARAEQRFADVRTLANSLIVDVYAAIHSLPGATAASRQVAERAQTYLEKLASETDSDPALLVELANAYRSLAATQGDINGANLGDTNGALKSYQRAATLLQSALALQHDSVDTQVLLARTHLDIATSWWAAVQKDAATRSHQQAVAILEPLAKAHPQNNSVQLALATALQFQSVLYTYNNDLPNSLAVLLKADAIYRGLLSAQPSSAALTDNVALSDKRVGAIQIQLGQLTEALVRYREALGIDTERLTTEPLNTDRRYAISYSYSNIGLILSKQGDLQGALSYYRRAEAIREALVAADPQDARARERLALTLNKIGDVQYAQRDFSAALVSYRRALEIRQQFAAKSPNDDRAQFNVADTQSLIGVLYATRAKQENARASQSKNDCNEAHKWLRLALPTWRRLHTDGKILAGDKDIARFEAAIDSCSRLLANADVAREQ